MSAADDEDLIGGDPAPGFTMGDLTEILVNLPSDYKTQVIAKAIRRDPTMIGGLLFPELEDPARLEGTTDVQRELHKEAVKDAVRLIRASRSEPVYPRNLEITAEALAEGLLQAPTPSVGGLLYPGRVSALYGSHTAGKTWTALYVACRHAKDEGGRTLFLDYEDTESGIAARCVAMDPKLPAAVAYYAPVGVLTAASLSAVIESRGITLVILDSVGESMAASGYDSNSEQDVTTWFTEVPDGIAALGPAVLLLDHIAKKQDGTPSPVGSFRKSAAITGAQFALENKIGFSRHQSGWSKLTCTKDRNGFFATGEVVGRIDFRPDDGNMELTLQRGEVEARLVTDRLENAIVDYVRDRMEEVHGQVDDQGEEMDGRPSITQIREAVKKGGVPAHNSKIREAVDHLVSEGWLVEEHLKSGKSTRDVYVPGTGRFEPITEDDDLI